jgi:hypothetical protein
VSDEHGSKDRPFALPRFCSHKGCLEGELRFLVEVDAVLWRQSASQQRSYQLAASRFREELAQQAVHHEPRV